MTKYEAPSTDDRRIWDLWLSGTYQGAIVAADDAGVFMALAEDPATIEELAARLDFDVRATGILMRLLGSLGLLMTRDERFQLADQARQYLVKSSPFYWGHMMRVAVSEWHRDTALAKLKAKGSASTAGPQGTPGRRRAPAGRPTVGRPAKSRLARPTRSRHRCTRTPCRRRSAPPATTISRASNDILDVGGGSGCFMIAFAQAHPKIKATILELPSMCEAAATYIEAGAVGNCVDTTAINMFRDPWPKGYDAIFFSNIWHDWNFRTCAWLAERAYEALPPGGRIMLHEMLLDDDGAGPATTAAFSMLMLLATQGQQFTFGEIKKLLEQAGFRDIETQQTAGYYSMTTGYKR